MTLGEKMIDKIASKKTKEGSYLHIEGALLDKKLWHVDECTAYDDIMEYKNIFMIIINKQFINL